MSQISDAGRAGDEANKIRQRLCQGHAVQSHCSARTRLSRLEAGHCDCELQNFIAGPDPPGPVTTRPGPIFVRNFTARLGLPGPCRARALVCGQWLPDVTSA